LKSVPAVEALVQVFQEKSATTIHTGITATFSINITTGMILAIMIMIVMFMSRALAPASMMMHIAMRVM
jgi:hypothetical protein